MCSPTGFEIYDIKYDIIYQPGKKPIVGPILIAENLSCYNPVCFIKSEFDLSFDVALQKAPTL